MDASYKQYEHKKSLDAVAISGIDAEKLAKDFVASGSVNETEGWATGFNAQLLKDAQAQAQQKLEDHIKNQMQNPTVGDVIGGAKTIVQEFPMLPSALPNPIVATGARYDKLPVSLQQHIRYSFDKDIEGNMVDPIDFAFAKVNNQKLTLSFKPATTADEDALKSLLPEGEITNPSQLPTSIPSYLIKVIPELKLNGQTVKSGNAMKLGEEVPFVTGVSFAGRGELQSPRTYNVIAGSYLSINAIAGSVSSDELNKLKTTLKSTKTKLESKDKVQIAALTREELLGDLFRVGSLGYYAQLIGLNQILGLQSGVHYQLSAGTGTFGYEPKVSYFFGFPKAIQPGGAVFDIPLSFIVGVNEGDAAKKKEFVLQSGILSSTLEHAVPEQMFTNAENPGEAISAVKALQKANAAGQRTYHITQANQATTLPNIHHDSDTMTEIRNALNVGKEVITHTDKVSIPGWTGAGYIIIDQNVGDGAYKIAGGANGGTMVLDWIKDNPGGAAILGLVLGLLAGVGGFFGAIAFLLSLAIGVISLYYDSLTVLNSKCGGVGLQFLFIGVGVVIFALGLAAGAAVGAAIALAVGGYLWGQLFTGIQETLSKGAHPLCN